MKPTAFTFGGFRFIRNISVASNTRHALPPIKIIPKLNHAIGLYFGIAIFLTLFCLPVSSIAAASSNFFWSSLLTQKETLYFANYPERIVAPGTVISQALDPPSSRLMYYYYNPTSKLFWINLIVQNTSKKVSKIRFTSGLGGPNIDGLYAGHSSALNFFKHLKQSKYDHYEIQPNEYVQLLYHAIKPSMISSGIARIEILNNVPLHMKLQIVESGFQQFTEFVPKNLDQTPYSFSEVKNALFSQTVQYQPSDILVDTLIGAPPFVQDQNNRIIKGNYGVLYHVTLKLNNNTKRYEQIDLLFSRISGFSRAVILLDDTILSTQYYKTNVKHDPEKLHSFVLPPNTRKTVNLCLIPQGGGFYPVKLAIKSTPVQPKK